jgi:hypothetical protein
MSDLRHFKKVAFKPIKDWYQTIVSITASITTNNTEDNALFQWFLSQVAHELLYIIKNFIQ